MINYLIKRLPDFNKKFLNGLIMYIAGSLHVLPTDPSQSLHLKWKRTCFKTGQLGMNKQSANNFLQHLLDTFLYGKRPF